MRWVSEAGVIGNGEWVRAVSGDEGWERKRDGVRMMVMFA